MRAVLLLFLVACSSKGRVVEPEYHSCAGTLDVSHLGAQHGEKPDSAEPEQALGWAEPRDTWDTCHADGLPRLVGRSAAEVRAFEARAREGTMAVAWIDGQVEPKPACRLPGVYRELRGLPGSVRFRASNRVLIRVDEIGDDCAGATHAVAAYVLHGGRLEAVLVPLPCPPTSDEAVASRCVGMGQTGAQRLAQAAALVDHGSDARALRDLTAYALAPDAEAGLGPLRGLQDCSLQAQGRWVTGHVRARTSGEPPAASPVFDPKRGAPLATGCLHRPAFTGCFAEVFLPAIDADGGFVLVAP